jgi:hypothetical protein
MDNRHFSYIKKMKKKKKKKKQKTENSVVHATAEVLRVQLSPHTSSDRWNRFPADS